MAEDFFMLIDTHSHVNMMVKETFDTPLPEDFKHKAELIINNAAQSNVSTLINVGTSLVESINCVELARTFDNCFATLGIHPNDITEKWESELIKFSELLEQKKELKIVGIGEIGLDYHYPKYNKELQYTVLRKQIQMALAYDLPIVIHTRDAEQEVLGILEEYKQDKKLRGIIHCFSEDLAFAERALKLGFVLGIGGPLTYPKNDTLREVFSTVPLEKIVLETDSPFLPPQKFRGQKNYPAHVKIVALALAELRGITYEEVARVTTSTATTLFGL
jgi:TatD DNase family protein